METTPAHNNTVAKINTTPLTMAAAAQVINEQCNVSPVGSTGTAYFTDTLSEHDFGEEPLKESTKAKEVAPKTPKKTVLPDDYPSSTGCTPYDDWRILNHRVNFVRPDVPGATSTPSKPPGPFYVDTPPSSS